jgi:sec-independent protein translocase protein TatA
MGIEGISPLRLLIILAIVLVLFGGKRLRSLGGDLGGAIKGFRNAMKEGERDGHPTDPDRLVDGRSAADAPASTARREHQDS